MTGHFIETIRSLKSEALQALVAVKTPEQLEEWRIRYVGRQGELPLVLRRVKELPAADRRRAGQAGNELRIELTEAYEEKKKTIPQSPAVAKTQKSPRAVSPISPRGHLHPLTLSIRKMLDIFSSLGFLVVEGPEVEEARYNFDLLNIALEHPARAETDTFYVKDFPNLVLRTHVSPLQIRGVLENNLTPPFSMVYYGPSYRAEKEDATHAACFHQYEFMVVGEAVTLADLKGIATHIYASFFDREVEIRFRPSYFPFVEPGLEVHMRDNITGKGGWLEMAGAGMVHPNVLRNINVDPRRYQGIALGGGVDRLAMLKYGIPDVRLLYSGDMQFLTQFS